MFDSTYLDQLFAPPPAPERKVAWSLYVRDWGDFETLHISRKPVAGATVYCSSDDIELLYEVRNRYVQIRHLALDYAPRYRDRDWLPYKEIKPIGLPRALMLFKTNALARQHETKQKIFWSRHAPH